MLLRGYFIMKQLEIELNNVSYVDEFWKDVKGYEGIFKASSLGRVMSVKRAFMKHDVIVKGRLHKGYMFHETKKTNNKKTVRTSYAIHRLVALAWHDNPLNKETVNHEDGNKTNNRPENLTWMTVLENIEHARRTGLCRKLGFGNPLNQCNKAIKQCDINNNLIEIHISAVVAANKVNGNNRSIHHALNRTNNIYKGYKWYYV